MYTILSPSKTQDFQRGLIMPGGSADLCRVSEWNEQTKELAQIMKEFSATDLEKMMKISPKLAQLNFERFQDWNGDYSTLNGDDDQIHYAPAIRAFLGDVYKGFELEQWGSTEYTYADSHLGIMSGFYGLISPLNYMQPYRLEMGTKISFTIDGIEYKNLYTFWTERLTEKMYQILKEEKMLINLASVEYSKVIDRKLLKQKAIDAWRGKEGKRNEIQIIDIDFKIRKKDKKTGEIVEKVIAIYAKRARGLMANWIVESKVNLPKELENFSTDKWQYQSTSEADKLGNKRMLFIKEL